MISLVTGPFLGFTKLMSNIAWYMSSDPRPGLGLEAPASDRYLFESAEYDALDGVLQGGLRACRDFADQDFQPAVLSSPFWVIFQELLIH